MKKYYLVADATAEEVERKTGLPGHNTSLGALVEQRDPVIEAMRMKADMDFIDRALNPKPPRCCSGTFLHAPNCPTWGVTS